MFNSTPQDMEFAQKAMVLTKCRNPLMKRDDKIKVLCGFVDSLSPETFAIYSTKILQMVNLPKDRAVKFKNTDEQYQSMIKEVPRFELLKDELMAMIKKARENFGLEI